MGIYTAILLQFFSVTTYAATPIVNIEIRNHLFIPSEITIPENTKVKLVIHNHDATDEEFESYELNREKVIIGERKGIIFIGPLPAGEYPFFGEFFPKTAQGKVIVEKNIE
ncbi:cupredoxin domain-containing protein [sulfur-oxidizing endosymbiont of Gigantopelta aegis]|uniref:cupredoxin domain-containing protein n=1 Tax=sulfur-oxidizing endosymbiont of Gigantopelta aegis TaxID=2794934 RepID=UPI0018DDD99F|nr:cupredoxin domain-containing protein [sulfur-oxidizing endosymbiont of Gigantopelta aegis]